MNRQVLAAEALHLSRSILVDVPVQVRIATLARGFVRQALTPVDLHLAIGLHALLAMEKAGTQGSIEGKTIEELRPWIKRNVLSKLKGPALGIGGKIYNMSMAGKGKVSLLVLEEAWEATKQLLEQHPLAGDKNVGQVVAYIARGLTMRIQDALKIRKRRTEIESDPDFLSDTGSERDVSPADLAEWKEVERRFKSDPLLLGPKGEPWAWIYIEGRAGGMTEPQIIDQWNEASRRSGGEGGVTRTEFLNWLRLQRRRALMVELTKRYLDDSTIRRLKLAVRLGALKTAMLQPFELDLLELLAA